MTWQATTYLVLVAVVAIGAVWFERRRPSSRVVALVASMAALAVVGRLAFAALPNVKPTTDVVLFAGYALGAAPGFMVGAVTALASNVFFGQGSWTVWQMVAWGGVGISGAGLARLLRGREPNRWVLAVFCGVAGLAFGAFMDVYQWSFAARQTAAEYVTIAGLSLPYNLAHVAGNVVFCLALGPAFVRALRRYRRRFEVDWQSARPPTRFRPGGAVPAVLVALVVCGVALAAAARPADASPAGKAVSYLKRVQNRDGGFAATRGGSSSQLFTGWAALGLAAARANPRDVSRERGRSVATYLRRGGAPRDVGELERTILVLRASGLPTRRFRDRDLVADLVRRQRSDGSWRSNVSHTAFGILALRAAGERAFSTRVVRAAAWLARSQNGDGGFGFVPSATSDVDDTGAALQAFAAAGRDGSGAKRAVGYLRRRQNRDGGFGQSEGRDSNSQSTAWAVQGLVAAGLSPRTIGADPIRYLTRLQRRDGHIAYSRASDQTPVWVTAQALIALRHRPFPLAAVPRATAGPRGRRRERQTDGATAAIATGMIPTAEVPTAKTAPVHRRGAKPSRRREPTTGQGAPSPATATPGPGSASSDGRDALRRERARHDGRPPDGRWWEWVAGALAALLAAGLGRRYMRAREVATG